MSETAPTPPAGPDLDPHWSTLPHAEVLAVLPEGGAATYEQLVQRLCPLPPTSADEDPLGYKATARAWSLTSTGGKLRNALREMVHAGTLRQFPEGRDLHAAAFWRAGDLAGQGEAAGREFMRLRDAVDTIAARYRAARELADEFHAQVPSDRGLNLYLTAEGLAGARLAFAQTLTTLEKLR